MNNTTTTTAGARTHSKTDRLLIQAFTITRTDGARVVAGSQVDTDQGTASQWSYLERAGYAEKATRTGRGILGHTFSRRLTDAGREHLNEILTP